MKGDIVISPTGEEIVLADIGIVELLDNDVVRVWDVTLDGHGRHPWHLHHNPYLVLSVKGSKGRMDWLDGSPPRFIEEYRGGAVYRPVSPVHRLTNLLDQEYQNRLVEFKALGEHLPAPLDVGPGARSIAGEDAGPDEGDGRRPVLRHDHASVWTVAVPAGEERELALADAPHLIVSLNADDIAHDPTGGVRFTAGGRHALRNASTDDGEWFVVELTYMSNLDDLTKEARA